MARALKRLPLGVARAMFWFVLGGLPWALALAHINERTTGDWLLLATRYLDPEEGLGFGVHGHTLRQGLQTTLLWGFETLGYTFFLSPLLLLAARKHAGPRARLLWLMLVAPVAGYLFYWNPGGNRYGPRFYFEALLPFTMLTGVGLARVLELRRYRLLVAVAATIGLAALGRQCYDAWAQIHARLALHRAVESQHIHHAVVLLETGSADMPAYDLTRNPPDFRQADVLYAHAGEADAGLAAAFPDRRLYTYHWNEAGGTLRPMPILTIPGRR